MGLRPLQAKARWLGACAALVAGCESIPPNLVEIPAVKEGVVQDELIAMVTPGADADDLEALYSDLGVTVRQRLTRLSADLLGVDPAGREEVRDALEQSLLVDDVLDNRLIDVEVTPNDPDYPLQWHLPAVEAPAAWDVTTGSEQVLVAVLDTGVDPQHPDLASKLWFGGNTLDGTASWGDVRGHGTAVAGVIAAASDSAGGVASVAWKNPVMPIRVTGDDNQTNSWALAAGIALAVDQGAKVINISFAPLHDDEIVLRQAGLARLAGALVVCSAGNTGQEVFGGGSEAVLFVGAEDRDGSLAGFSTFGEFVDLVAPGVGIYTTQFNGAYGTSTGASFAAPIVSGVAALVWSVNPELWPTTVQGILLSTATDLGPAGDDACFGAGRVNARAAVELARAIVEQRDETPPVVSIRQPADGSVVRSPSIVEIQVTDDNDIAGVTLWVDDLPLGTDVISPYAFVVDPARHAAGQHAVSAVATDVFGNSAEHRITLELASAEDRVPPNIRIVGPAEGSVLSGVVTILAHVLDDRAMARAEVLVDGRAIWTTAVTGAEARIAHNWNTAAADVAPGPHVITVRVVDTSENAGSASVGVTVRK